MNNRNRICRLMVISGVLFFCISVTAQTFDARLFFSSKDSANNCIKRRDWAGAKSYLEKVVTLNPLRGENWSLLGKIFYRTGEYSSAIPFFQKALDLQDGLPYYTAYYIANCYAKMGDKKKAMDWLRKAFALGFESLDEAKADPDLAVLHDMPDFKTLMGDIDGAGFSRTEALRFELSLLVREIERVLYWPYRTISKEDFAAEVHKIYLDIPHLSKNQYSVRLMQLMVKLGDGHTHAFPDWHTAGTVWYLPLRFFKYTDGVFITSTDSANKNLLGARILEVEGTPIEDAWKKIATIANRDNDFGTNEGVAFLLRCPQLAEGIGLSKSDEKMTFKLALLNGKTEMVTVGKDTLDVSENKWIQLHETLPGDNPLYLTNMGKKYWFTEIPEQKMMYFQFNQVFNMPGENFTDFCARLTKYIPEHKIENLVIDMRWNNGGNGNLAVPLLNALLSLPQINQKGHLFVITGRKTFSAAMITSALIERFSNAIFVGEQTGSSPNFVGEDNHFTLPYSKTDICLSTRFHQNSWGNDHRPWIAPEIYTPPSFDFYRQKRDPAMEAIISFLR